MNKRDRVFLQMYRVRVQSKRGWRTRGERKDKDGVCIVLL